MDLRVSILAHDHVELFGYSDDDQVRVFITLTLDEAERLGEELRDVRAAAARCEQ